VTALGVLAHPRSIYFGSYRLTSYSPLTHHLLTTFAKRLETGLNSKTAQSLDISAFQVVILTEVNRIKQHVELTVNQWVAGSSPAGGAIFLFR
jgi:hypothetical protein